MICSLLPEPPRQLRIGPRCLARACGYRTLSTWGLTRVCVPRGENGGMPEAMCGGAIAPGISTRGHEVGRRHVTDHKPSMSSTQPRGFELRFLGLSRVPTVVPWGDTSCLKPILGALILSLLFLGRAPDADFPLGLWGRAEMGLGRSRRCMEPVPAGNLASEGYTWCEGC